MDRRAVLREALLDLLNDELDASWTNLADEVHFASDLGLDSVDTFSLIMQVERHFRVRLSNSELHSVENEGHLLDLVALKLQQSSVRAA